MSQRVFHFLPPRDLLLQVRLAFEGYRQSCLGSPSRDALSFAQSRAADTAEKEHGRRQLIAKLGRGERRLGAE